MAFFVHLLVLIVAGFAALYAHQSSVLQLKHDNDPLRFIKLNTFKSHQIKFADQVRSCEDVLLLEERGLALMACDPGRERWNTVMGVFVPGPVTSAKLYAYNYLDTTTPDSKALKSIDIVGFPGVNDFHTLGLAYDEKTSTLFAVNHAKAGNLVEKFHLDMDKLVATHKTTIEHRLIPSPNSIAIINENEFYVTNDHLFPARFSIPLSRMETMLGLPLGTVVRVKLSAKGELEQVTKLAQVAFANGIEIINSTTMAVAATSRRAVYFYTIQNDSSLKYRSQIIVPFLPDNLSLSGNKLMIAGHPHFPTLAKFSATRHICNDPKEFDKADKEMKAYCLDKKAAASSYIVEWSEEHGLQALYAETEYPSSATGARDAKRKIGVIGGLYAKGILIWKD